MEATRKKRTRRKRKRKRKRRWWWWCSGISSRPRASRALLPRPKIRTDGSSPFLGGGSRVSPVSLVDLVARIAARPHPPGTRRYRGKVTVRSPRPQVRSAGEKNHRAGASRGATPHLGSLSPRLRRKMRSAGTRSLRRSRQCGAARVERRD